MKIIRNKYIPFKGFSAINIFGVIYAKENTYISERTIRHESIHTAQMKEMLYVFFYLWYVVEWVIRLFMEGNVYRNISFEREVYSNVGNKRVVKDNTKLIIALMLLVVIVLMAILRAHPVASIITAIPIGVLNYLIYRDK